MTESSFRNFRSHLILQCHVLIVSSHRASSIREATDTEVCVIRIQVSLGGWYIFFDCAYIDTNGCFVVGKKSDRKCDLKLFCLIFNCSVLILDT
jgi:hypothetical protein